MGALSLISIQGSNIIDCICFSSKIFFNKIDGLPTIKFVSFLNVLPKITIGKLHF